MVDQWRAEQKMLAGGSQEEEEHVDISIEGSEDKKHGNIKIGVQDDCDWGGDQIWILDQNPLSV